VQRRGLGILFSVLAAAFLLIAVAATGHGVRGWVIAVAAAAIAVWMGSLAHSAFRS
jgi:hypothetical protein